MPPESIEMSSIGDHLRAVEERLAFSDVIGAARLCADALKLAPDNIRLLEIGADCAFKLWDNDTAAWCYAKLRAAKPDDAGVLIRMGETYERMGRFGQAGDAAEALLRLDPNSPLGHVLVGRCYEALGRWEQAIAHLEKGNAVSRPESVAALVRAYRRVGKRADAVAALRQIAPIAKQAPEHALPLADQTTDFAFSAAESGDLDTVTSLASILAVLADPDRAELLFRFAIDAAPADVRHSISLAQFLHASGRSQDALDILRAWAARPGIVSSERQLLAEAFLSCQAVDDAAGMIEHWLEAEPPAAKPLMLTAFSLKGVGSTDRAEALLRTALARYPQSAAIVAAYVAFLADECRYADGRTTLNNLMAQLERAEGSKNDFTQLGATCESVGELGHAIRAYRQACETGGPQPEELERFANCQRKLGQAREATLTSRALFDRFPDYKSKLNFHLACDGPDALEYQDTEFRVYLNSGNDGNSIARRLLDHPEDIRKIVSINLWGRAGSYLFSSLLDAHPEIIQIMPHHGIRQITLKMVSDMQAFADTTKSIGRLVNQVVAAFREGYQGSPWQALDESQAPAFSEALYYALKNLGERYYLNADTIFRSIHAAHALAEGRNFGRNPIVSFQSHLTNSDYRPALAEGLPGTHFVTCVRYPPRAYDSHVHHHVLESPIGDPFTIPNLIFGWLAEFGDWRYGIDLEGCSMVVRFEDIHNHTEFLTRWLARWLDIEWQPVMLESTIRGLPWGGMKGNTGTRRMTRKDLAMQSLSQWDKQKLMSVFQAHMSAWGYWMPADSKRQALMNEQSWLRQRTFEAPFDLHSKALDIAIANGVAPETALNQMKEADGDLRKAMDNVIARHRSAEIRLLPMLYRAELEATCGLSPLLDET